jgi:N-acetylmuramoyl-L-alanine amidase
MVDEDMRAWHAGASSWDGREDVNSRSIGIEIVNPGHGPDYRDFPDAADRGGHCAVTGHHLASRHSAAPCAGAFRCCAGPQGGPGRKVSVGRAGRARAWGCGSMTLAGHWLNDDGDLREGRLRWNTLRPCGATSGPSATVLGKVTQFDSWTQTVVRTFQMHYRPSCCDGVADAQTRAVLHCSARQSCKLNWHMASGG